MQNRIMKKSNFISWDKEYLNRYNGVGSGGNLYSFWKGFLKETELGLQLLLQSNRG